MKNYSKENRKKISNNRRKKPTLTLRTGTAIIADRLASLRLVPLVAAAVAMHVIHLSTHCITTYVCTCICLFG